MRRGVANLRQFKVSRLIYIFGPGGASSDVAAAAVVRVTRAARAVAAAGVVGLALDNHTVAVVAVDEQRQQEGDEEEDAVPGDMND